MMTEITAMACRHGGYRGSLLSLHVAERPEALMELLVLRGGRSRRGRQPGRREPDADDVVSDPSLQRQGDRQGAPGRVSGSEREERARLLRQETARLPAREAEEPRH